MRAIEQQTCPFCGQHGGFEVLGPIYRCRRPSAACRLLYAFHELTGEADLLDVDLDYFDIVARPLESWPTPPSVH